MVPGSASLFSAHDLTQMGYEIHLAKGCSYLEMPPEGDLLSQSARIKLEVVHGQFRLPAPLPEAATSATMPQLMAPIEQQFDADSVRMDTTMSADNMIMAASAVPSTSKELRVSWDILHRRFGHCNDEALKSIASDMPNGPLGQVDRAPCPTCPRANKRNATGKRSSTKPEVGQLIQMDLMGPLGIGSISDKNNNGQPYKYIANFKDMASMYETPMLMVTKDETSSLVREYLAAWRASGRELPNRLRCDNDFLKEVERKAIERDFPGVLIEYSNPYEQFQNGGAEKNFQDTGAMARSMCLDSAVPRCFDLWAYRMAAERRNVMPRASLGGKSPLQVFFEGTEVDMEEARAHFLVPFCKVYAPVLAPQRRKDRTEATRHLCAYLGHSQNIIMGKRGAHSIVVWDLEMKRIRKVSKVFDVQESVSPFSEGVDLHPLVGRRVSKQFTSISSGEQFYSGTVASYFAPYYSIAFDDGDMAEADVGEAESMLLGGATENVLSIGAVSHALSFSGISSAHQFDNTLSRLSSTTVEASQTSFAVAALAQIKEKQPEVLTLRKAMLSPQSKEWSASVDREISKLDANGSFEFVSMVPSGTKIMHSKFVLKIKQPSGEYKARLVILGDKDETQYEHNQTYAPVGEWSHFRALLALANHEGLPVMQFDWNCAFTQADAPEGHDIFIRFPAHCKHAGRIARLKRNLYGLKTAPRTWYNEVKNYFVDILGFAQCDRDPCLFSRGEGEDKVMLGLYVDDLLCVPASTEAYNIFRDSITERYDIDEMGEVRRFLNLDISRDYDKGTLSISPAGYIRDILGKNGFNNCKPVSSPGTGKAQTSIANPNREVDTRAYSSKVGALTFLAATRLDIAADTGIAAQFLKAPTASADAAVDRIFRYLAGTIDKAIVFRKEAGLGVTTYCDSDGMDDISRRPRIGVIMSVGGAPLYGSSSLAATVTTSVCEGELIAITQAIKIAIPLSGVLDFLGYPKQKPWIIRSDNQGAVFASLDDSSVKRLKHIDIRYKFLLQFVRDGTFKTVYCRTEYNLADVFTKSLPLDAHRRFVNRLVS